MKLGMRVVFEIGVDTHVFIRVPFDLSLVLGIEWGCQQNYGSAFRSVYIRMYENKKRAALRILVTI